MGKLMFIFVWEMAVPLHNRISLQVELSKNTGIPRSTVGVIISKYKRYGHVRPSVSIGRPPKVSIHSNRLLKRLSNTCPFLTSKQLKSEWSQGHKVSTRTVGRYLQKTDEELPKNPILSEANKTAKFSGAKNTKKRSSIVRKSGFLRRNFDRPVSKKALFVLRPSESIERYESRPLAMYPKYHNKKLLICSSGWSSGHCQLVRVQGSKDSTQYSYF